MPAVSIIMPVYNTEKFIERSIRSALGQTFEDLEIIVVDDCTPDNSIGIVKSVLTEYPHRQHQVRIISNPTNMGLAVARQTGLDSSTGEYTIHLDSDDYFDPQMIEDLYAKAKEDDADIVICDYYETYLNKEIYRRQPAAGSGKLCAAEIMGGSLHGAVWNKLIRKELYTAHGISTVPGINMWEDILATVRLCYFAQRVSYVNKAYLHYVNYNSNSYISLFSDNSLANLQSVVELLSDFYMQNDPDGLYSSHLNYLKVTVKCLWMRRTRGERRRQLLKLYPEADGYIFSHPSVRLPTKLSLCFALNGLFWLSDMTGNAVGKWKKIKIKG